MWDGRLDSFEIEDLRLWQIINSTTVDNLSITRGDIVFSGYDTDEGVIRNLGRAGAKDGPMTIRKCCSSLPYLEEFGEIYDLGNINISNLEDAQKELSKRTAEIVKLGGLPLNLGGGHDIAYGTYKGIRKVYPDKKIGIINFDAHLDMRCYETQATSGTMFKQILDHDKNVEYNIVGYQNLGNTLRLRNLAKDYNVNIYPVHMDINIIIEELLEKIKKYDLLYITICMDVFDITEAPGVSAPSSIGFEKYSAIKLFNRLSKSSKLVAVDFAEVNPSLDVDNKTSRLVSNLIYKIMENRGKRNGI